MADNTEDVKYSLQGDVRSLKHATETAIQLLDNYQKTVTKAVAAGKFNASARSTQSFNTAINKTIKDVEKMAAKLKKVGDVKLPASSDTSKAFESTMATVAKQMDTISNATKITTKDLTQLKTELNATRTALTGTAPQVDKLVASEQKFQHVLGVVDTKAKQVRATMDTMKSKLGSAFDPVANRVKSLSGVFDNIKAKIQSFKDKATESFSRVGTLASTVASAFRRTSTEADKGDASSGRFAKALEKVSNAFSKLKSGASKVSSLFGTLLTKLSSLGTQASRTNTSFKNLHSTTNLLSKAFVALTGVKIGDWLADATKQSISYIENLNLFKVAMGDAVDEGIAFVNTMQELYGMDPSNLMRYAGNFYQLATAIEMPDAAATNLSLVLTKASNDIASLFNMDVETVFGNLASGMQGMSRAVRKYGMDIRVTTLQTTAATLGIYDQVESMSEANRMGLRFLTMMKQASNASGDFARTIETPANQLRIFREQMSQLGRAIGNFFIGPLGTAISYINGFIMALRTVLTFIADTMELITGLSSSFDPSGADEEADAIAGVGDAAGAAAKKIKNLISPFDELNILQDNTQDAGGGGGGGSFGSELMDPRIADAIAQLEYKFEEIEMKANRVRNAILEFLGFKVDMGKILSWNPDILEENLINKFPQWTKTIQATFDHWGEIIDGFKAVFTSLGGVVDSMKQKVLDFFSIFINDDSVSQFISNLGDNLQKLADWITQHEEGIANFALTFISLWGAFKLFSGVATILGPVVTTISNIAKVLTPLGSVLSTLVGFINPVTVAIAAVVGIFALAYTQFESVRNAVDGLKDSFSQMVDNVSEAFTALWDDILKPVIDNIVSVFKELWSKHLSKLVEEIGLGVTAIIDFIMSVVGVVSELITFLSSTFGPVVSTVINFVVDLFGTFLGIVSDVITRILAVLRGLITFITGVFQGDWKKAWSGIVTAFKNVFGLIKDILKGIINVGIDLINGLVSAIWNAIRGIINGVGSVVQQLGELLGKKNWGWKLTAQPPRIPHLKTGGVVTSPTYALIGEGGKDEAVIPLDNSPQMAQLVQQIADAVRDIPRGGGSGSTNQPIEVRVFLDSREITSAQNRNNRMYGKTTQNV